MLAQGLFMAVAIISSTVAGASEVASTDPRLAVFTTTLPISVIKFKDQPEDSKVLAVTVGHLFGTARTQFTGQYDPRDPSTGKDHSKIIPSRYFSDEYGFLLDAAAICPKSGYLDCLRNSRHKRETHGSRRGVSAPEARVRYFSQTGMDIMVLEYDLTYKELRQIRNIEPFLVSETTPLPGESAVFYSSVTALDGDDQRALQVCSYSNLANVEFNHGAIRFDGLYKFLPHTSSDGSRAQTVCRSLSGDSGSPVINPETLEILGIVTGSNQRDNLFVTPLHGLKGCLDTDFRFNLYLPTCSLQQIRYHGGR